MSDMYINELMNNFIGYFGGKAEGIRVFSSPGRVNLIGEHTDYNGGYAFPTALQDKNISLFGRYMIQSHYSLRYLYEVTGPELDALVEEALKINGVAGLNAAFYISVIGDGGREIKRDIPYNGSEV